MLEAMRKWCEYELVDLKDEEKRAEMCGISTEDVRKDVLGIVLAEPLESAKAKAKYIFEKGVLPEFYFSRNGLGTLSRKAYINSVGGRPVTNFWSFEETGHTDEASRLLKSMFNGTAVFDTPKPPRLIERILHIVGDKNALILDSFAGSGTTAHAVLNMNKADGGNRKFILIEMMDYADSITSERVKRVIDGYKDVEGTGGDFTYYELGEPLLKADRTLNEEVPVETIRQYIWHTETRSPYVKPENENPSYLGEYNHTAYYFHYKKDELTVLDYDHLAGVNIKADSYVIYADICILSPEELAAYNITFKKIPRDITKI